MKLEEFFNNIHLRSGNDLRDPYKNKDQPQKDSGVEENLEKILPTK